MTSSACKATESIDILLCAERDPLYSAETLVLLRNACPEYISYYIGDALAFVTIFTRITEDP